MPINPSVIEIFTFAAASFALAIALTPFWTSFLYNKKMSKQLREKAWDNTSAEVYLKMHEKKAGTPTMGGVLIWGTATILTLFFNLSRSQTWLPVFTLATSGVLGLIDDYMNIKGISAVKGLGMKTKFLFQFLIAAVGAWWFVDKLDFNSITIPIIGTLGYDPVLIIGPFLFAALFILTVIFISNAVNITDGLDGLAGGVLATSYGAFALISFMQGRVGLAIFCATILGALLAFLWFNIHPARFFMGDTGSLALGATLAVIAMLTDSLVVLPIIGLVFVAEGLSSILQRFSKKYLGRKIFISAPLHHHFEAIGWPETKVTMRFWIISSVAAVLGVTISLIGR
ncbi:MAG: phospho-N-acetylmuramoyl-pentapeptide-transferase [Candidatus Doudnabacteria bacterium]|nr:phospho-N-acetylmuramoyl-pentapeptide-transferase [Candidatus Doudnabacteria bacterium]